MHLDGLISAAADHVVARADVMDRRYLLGVVLDCAMLFSGFDVPNFNGIVGSGTGDAAAVRFPGDS